MTGNIHGRLNRCLDGTIRLVKLVFMDFAPAIFNSIAAIVVIFMTLPPILAFPMLFVIPIGVAIVMRQISTQRGIRVELLDKKASMDGAIVELLNGIEVIRVADSISAEESRFDRKSEALRSKEMKHHVQMAKYDCLKFINEVVFTVLMIGISAYLAAQGVISVGAVLTAYLCFMQLSRPLEELHRILDELSEGMILAEDFFKMAEIENDFSYAEIEPRAEPREKLPGILEIQNLWFSYDDHKPILKGISLSRHDLSQAVALVPQNPFLIAGTIYENICYGLDETPTQQEIEDAIQKTCLDEFINSLPDKIHTVLSEKGENLSGGQRQRISIARIFLRKPKILILDEATSALDNTMERFIQNAIEALQKERQMTVISIAHRLTTLKNSDRIIVMNEGEVVQTGTYQELIASQGIFQDMYYGRLK